MIPAVKATIATLLLRHQSTRWLVAVGRNVFNLSKSLIEFSSYKIHDVAWQFLDNFTGKRVTPYKKYHTLEAFGVPLSSVITFVS